MEKEAARARVRRAVERLTAGERAGLSRAVHDRLMALPEMHSADAVMLFVSMADEVDTLGIIASCLGAGKAVYAPASTPASRRMTPRRVRDATGLRPGAYGILEPPPGESCAARDLDLILVPARGFDRQGNRLGRGAGFYDRFMAAPDFHATRVGIGFACQVLDAVPCDAHDLPVQVIVTDAEVIRV